MCSNGVRQVGVASPVLFTIYMDEHTTRLEKLRKIWHLPFECHRNILCGLNNGEHIWDCICKRFCGMCESMTNSKNKKLEYLVKLGNQDCRTIITKNIRVICDKWKVCEKQLWNKWKNAS